MSRLDLVWKGALLNGGGCFDKHHRASGEWFDML